MKRRDFFSMLNKRWWQAHRIRFTESVCKPPEGAVFKRYGAERSGKDTVQAASGKCKEAERK
jgi:hypothetical protein